MDEEEQQLERPRSRGGELLFLLEVRTRRDPTPGHPPHSRWDSRERVLAPGLGPFGNWAHPEHWSRPVVWNKRLP